MSGFLRGILLFMRSFYAAWDTVELVSQPVSKLEDEPPEPLALLPWSTNLILPHKLKDAATRLWYPRKAVKQGRPLGQESPPKPEVILAQTLSG
jgi:hypothetical protein